MRIVDGTLRKGQRIRMMGTNAAYDVDRTGVFTPKLVQVDQLGQVMLNNFSEKHSV